MRHVRIASVCDAIKFIGINTYNIRNADDTSATELHDGDDDEQ